MELNRDNVVYIDLEQSDIKLKEICDCYGFDYGKLKSIKSEKIFCKLWVDVGNENTIFAFIYCNNEKTRKELPSGVYIEKALVLKKGYFDMCNNDKDFLLSMISSEHKLPEDIIVLDKILEKISRFGINSLDKEEKEKLEFYSKK